MSGGAGPDLGARGDRRTTSVLVALVVGLAGFNVVRVLLVPEAWGTVANLAAAVLVAVAARAARMSAAELGLERDHVRDGFRSRGGVAGIVLVGLLAAALVPAFDGPSAGRRSQAR